VIKIPIIIIAINAAIARYERGLAKLIVQPNEGCNLGTINLGSFLLK
jgi:hypothetical protein